MSVDSGGDAGNQETTMMTTEIESSSRKTPTTTGPCGKRHRAGTECTACERILRRQLAAADALAALRTLPVGTIAVLDTRDGRGRARTLESADEAARRYADGCVDTEWGTEWLTAAGESVRFATDCGGYVPNSYGYAADADWLYVVAAEGRVVVYLERARTQSRPRGEGAAADRLLAPDRIRDAAVRGERHNAAWLVGLRAAARWSRLLDRRTAGKMLSPEDSVALDRALDLGWVEA